MRTRPGCHPKMANEGQPGGYDPRPPSEDGKRGCRRALRTGSAAEDALGVVDDLALQQAPGQRLELVVLDQHGDDVGVGERRAGALQRDVAPPGELRWEQPARG